MFLNYEEKVSEIKQRFLLGRKAMINPDSVLKNRDITLPTNVHIVTWAIWTINKAER